MRSTDVLRTLPASLFLILFAGSAASALAGNPGGQSAGGTLDVYRFETGESLGSTRSPIAVSGQSSPASAAVSAVNGDAPSEPASQQRTVAPDKTLFTGQDKRRTD